MPLILALTCNGRWIHTRATPRNSLNKQMNNYKKTSVLTKAELIWALDCRSPRGTPRNQRLTKLRARE